MSGMKLLRLDLLAFGPFTDLSLDLSAGDHGLHLIYGPNEAGKSSALRALRQLLFGIPHHSSDDFRHEHKKLRIGARLRAADGRTLEFLRKKGNKQTLLAADGKSPLDDGLLEDFLGRIDESTFATMFGIDHKSLVEAGKEIVENRGDLNETLFAAGAGLANLRSMMEALEEEADGLFKGGNASRPKINQLLKLLDVARAQRKTASLPDAEWRRHDQACRDGDEQKQRLDADLAADRRERDRLDRMRKALPAAARRKECLNDLRCVADALLLPDDFTQQRREAMAQLPALQHAERQAREELERIERQLAELDLPADVLEQAEAIESLQQRLGSYRKGLADRDNRLLVELRQHQEEAADLVKQLPERAARDADGTICLAIDQRQRILDLGNQHAALVHARNVASDEMARLGKSLAEVQARLAGWAAGGAGQPADSQLLDKAVRQALQSLPLEEQAAASRSELRQREEQAAVDLKKLGHWSGELNAIELLAVPGEETLERFRDDLEAAEAECQSVRGQVENLEARWRDLDRQIDQLRLEHEVPTEEDLAAVRRRRDGLWHRVRQSWHDGTGAVTDDPADVRQEREHLAAEFEAGLLEADDLSDRLRREADRVAAKARLLADREDCAQRLQGAKRQLDALTLRWRSEQERWSAAWRPLRIDPDSPKEMQVWVRRQQQLAAGVQRIREQRQWLADAESRLAAERLLLCEAFAAAGEPVANGNSLAALAERGQEIVRALGRHAEARREQQQEAARLERELPAARERALKAEAELAGWRREWELAVRPLGMAASATPSQANAVLQHVDHARDKLGKVKNLRERIEGIDRESADFSGTVAAVLKRALPAAIDLPADRAAEELNARLKSARAAEKTRDALRRQHATEAGRVQEARRKIESIDGLLDALCREANCDSREELFEAEQRSNRRRTLEAEVARLEEKLHEHAVGATLDGFVAEIEALPDPAGLEVEIGRLDERIAALDKQRSELLEQLGAARQVLKSMDGGGAAAEADEAVQDLETRLAGSVESYVRLRLATVLLREAMERYRLRHEGPVLRRASELFSLLTSGSFAALRPDYSDPEKPVLVGVRPGGEEVRVVGMSEGSCDQLYLALRLAGLEAWLDRHERLPFVVDDILIHFDNGRAAAALDALAELSRRTQVIFFTHHEHLLELASQRLAAGTLLIHRLPGSAAPASQPALEIAAPVKQGTFWVGAS